MLVRDFLDDETATCRFFAKSAYGHATVRETELDGVF
jgi:hypothetical protein